MSGPLIVRLRDEPVDHHRIRQSWFIGPDVDHLQLAGTLVLSVGEWQLLGTALLGGAEIMPGHLVIELDDERLALRRMCAEAEAEVERMHAVRIERVSS